MYNEFIDLVRRVQMTIIFEPYFIISFNYINKTWSYFALSRLPYDELGYLQTVSNFDSDATNNNWITVSSIGVGFNVFNIYFLIWNRTKIRFTELFSNLLILLACFDLLFLVNVIGIFGLPAVSSWYEKRISAKIFPVW